MHFVNFPFSICTFCIFHFGISHFAHFYVVYFAKLLKNISTFCIYIFPFVLRERERESWFLYCLSLLPVPPLSSSLLCVLWNVCYVRLLWNLHKMQMMPTPAAVAAAGKAEGKRKSGKDGKAHGLLPVALLVPLWLFWSFAISYLLKGLLVLHWHILLVLQVRSGLPFPLPLPLPSPLCKWAAAAFCFWLNSPSIKKEKYVEQFFYFSPQHRRHIWFKSWRQIVQSIVKCMKITNAIKLKLCQGRGRGALYSRKNPWPFSHLALSACPWLASSRRRRFVTASSIWFAVSHLLNSV